MSNPTEDLIEQMPAPSEFAEQITAPESGSVETPTDKPAAFTASADPVASAPDSPSVSDDSVFDPSIHEAGPDGRGILRKDGKGYRRKRGRKTGSVATGVGTGGGSPDPVISDQQRMVAARHAAQVSMACTFIMGQIVLGPEGAPIVDPQRGINEPGEFQQAYEQFYLLSEKPIHIPPWMLVALVGTTYISRRMAMEQPRSRVQRAFAWIKNRAVDIYVWWKGYKS